MSQDKAIDKRGIKIRLITFWTHNFLLEEGLAGRILPKPN